MRHSLAPPRSVLRWWGAYVTRIASRKMWVGSIEAIGLWFGICWILLDDKLQLNYCTPKYTYVWKHSLNSFRTASKLNSPTCMNIPFGITQEPRSPGAWPSLAVVSLKYPTVVLQVFVGTFGVFCTLTTMGRPRLRGCTVQAKYWQSERGSHVPFKSLVIWCSDSIFLTHGMARYALMLRHV